MHTTSSRLRSSIWLFITLTVSIFSHATTAQSFVYIGADPSGAKGDFMFSADATIDGEPFWEVMEPYIGKAGACQNPSLAALDVASDVVQGPTISQEQINLILRGFKRSEAWLTAKSLWPLKLHKLVPADPRAPQSVPIFCTLSPKTVDNPFLDYLSDSGIAGDASYFIIDGRLPESAQYPNRMVTAAASRALIHTLYLDVTQKVFVENNGRYFDSDLPVSEQDKNRQRFNKIVHSLTNAMAFAAAEYELGYGPAVIKHSLGSGSSTATQNYHQLAGGYTEPFYLTPKELESNLTSSGFLHFLFDGYLDVGFEAVPDFLYSLAISDNQLEAIDKFIDGHDGGFHQGLVHALPNFSGAAPNWSFYRGYGLGTAWRKKLFGSCESITLSKNKPVKEIDIKLNPYSSACMKIEFDSSDTDKLFDTHIKASTTDEKVNGIEVAFSQIKRSELTRFVDGSDCYKHLGFQTDKLGSPKVDRSKLAYKKSCLLAFSQGEDPKTNELRRFFYLFGEEAGDTTELDAVQMMLVVSYTPDEQRAFTNNDSEPANTKLVFSVDVAQSQSVLIDEDSVESVFGSKQGNMPITPAPIEKTDTFDDSVLEGKATAIDPTLLRAASSFADNAIGLKDDDNTSIQFQFTDPSVIDSKSVGEFEVIPVFQKEGFLAIPDGENVSKVNIIKHTKDTLYFEADAHICMIEPDEIMASLEQRYLDICKEGERHQVKAEIRIPFPDQFRSETKIVWKETDNYRASRAIRLHQMKQKFAANGLSNVTSNQESSSDQIRSSDTTATGIEEQMCNVKLASGKCNCSCEVKQCLFSKATLSKATLADSPDGLSCRLSCGKKWKACG